jgi:hypothetical protein
MATLDLPFGKSRELFSVRYWPIGFRVFSLHQRLKAPGGIID